MDPIGSTVRAMHVASKLRAPGTIVIILRSSCILNVQYHRSQPLSTYKACGLDIAAKVTEKHVVWILWVIFVLVVLSVRSTTTSSVVIQSHYHQLLY